MLLHGCPPELVAEHYPWIMFSCNHAQFLTGNTIKARVAALVHLEKVQEEGSFGNILTKNICSIQIPGTLDGRS
jgi:hypothetical protein